MAKNYNSLTQIGSLWIRFDEVQIINFDLSNTPGPPWVKSNIQMKDRQIWHLDSNDTNSLKNYLNEKAADGY